MKKAVTAYLKSKQLPGYCCSNLYHTTILSKSEISSERVLHFLFIVRFMHIVVLTRQKEGKHLELC